MRKTTFLFVLLLGISNTTHGARGTFKETVLGEEKVAKAAKGIEVKTKVTLPQQGLTGLCDADLSISYTQMNDRVRIVRNVANEDCPSSDGIYTLRIRTLGDNGEARTRTFEESWVLEDQKKDRTEKYYSMDGDTRLIWAKVKTSRKTRCVCRIPPPTTSEPKRAATTD
ncbi:MAG: hypothetical protein NZ743_11185 [Pseudomonadales bacterium]|jgi:hypothetical protein|nr:hypothetical protein [Pseudomonadales bacterium]